MERVTAHLDLAVSGFVPCDSDVFEPNDSAAQATVLTELPFQPVGSNWQLVVNSLTVCKPGTADWYAFDLEAGSHLSVSVAFPAGKDIDIYLYGPDGVDELDSGAGTSNPEVVDFSGDPVPGTGRYYLEVVLWTSNSSSTYQITATSDRPFICRQAPFDEFEPNGTPAEALAMPHLIQGTYDQLTLCGAEDDWYAVDLVAGQTLTATIVFDASTDIDLYLFDPVLALVGRSEGLTGVEQISFTAAADGPHYLQTYFNKHNPSWRAVYNLTLVITGP
jgi:hypothetical protein